MTAVQDWLQRHEGDLVDVRRQIHAYPELARHEFRTTELLVTRLRQAGLEPLVLDGGSGVICDVGRDDGPIVGLRADLDALPLQDAKEVPYRSTRPGVCHACGHDVHTAMVLGAGLALAEHAETLPGRVRLIFQPAEELMPGGALEVLAQGHGKGLGSIFSLHCDPSLTTGLVGLRVGPITAAADSVEVRLRGPGGHTARPHNTVDLIHALASVATGLPDVLSRVVDPRAGLCVVWGHVSAGVASNAIPRTGVLRGTLRVLDRAVWADTPELVERMVRELVAPYGAEVEVGYERGVPPVVNKAGATAILDAAVTGELGADAVVATEQSLGGEDFAWYLEQVPGAMARLGVRPPGLARAHDLHQAGFDVDETAIGIGVRLLAATALEALRRA